MPRIQVIYAITNALTGEVYVGSSTQIHSRWAEHKRELTGRRHKNALLQAAWERDGAAAFALSVIEVVRTREGMEVREQHYLDALRPHITKPQRQ